MPKAKSTPRRDILKLKVEKADGVYSLDEYQMSESIGYLLKRSYTLLSSAIDQDLSPYELTHPQFAILMMLKERNCSTAADLAREMCGDTGAITRMLDRLEAKDIIRRVRSKEDRRAVNIELTDTGKLVMAKMPVIAINVLNRYLGEFESSEIETLKHLLRKLIHQVETQDGTQPVPAPVATKPITKCRATKA